MLLWFWGSGRKKRFFDSLTLPMDSFLRLGGAGDTQASMTVAQQRASVARTGASIKRARGALPALAVANQGVCRGYCVGDALLPWYPAETPTLRMCDALLALIRGRIGRADQQLHSLWLSRACHASPSQSMRAVALWCSASHISAHTRMLTVPAQAPTRCRARQCTVLHEYVKRDVSAWLCLPCAGVGIFYSTDIAGVPPVMLQMARPVTHLGSLAHIVRVKIKWLLWCGSLLGQVLQIRASTPTGGRH